MKVILLGTKPELKEYIEKELVNSQHYQMVSKPNENDFVHQNRHDRNSPFYRAYIDIEPKKGDN